MDYLPICLDIAGRAVLVVGGGVPAARKAELLLRAGGRVTIVASDPGDEVRRLCERGAIRCRERGFAIADLPGVALVVAATGEPKIDRRVHEAAHAAGILVNVVDRPDLSSFVFPAVIDRSPLVIAVSSGGAAPVLVRQLRARLESLIPREYACLASLAGRFRRVVRRQIADPAARRRFWEAVFEGPVVTDMLAGREGVAASRLGAMLTRPHLADPLRGEVYFVGTGPEAPDLLTLRALRLMQQADIVLYDARISSGVLDLVRREAERIDVDQWRRRRQLAQDEIGRLMVRLARDGRRVLRLTDADPYLSGRGGKELDLLIADGIPYQLVPTPPQRCSSSSGGSSRLINRSLRSCPPAIISPSSASSSLAAAPTASRF